MEFKCGDIVIKKTGGNKMTIINEYRDGSKLYYKCYWFIDSDLNEKLFKSDEIIPIEEYSRFLKIEERDDKINQLLR